MLIVKEKYIGSSYGSGGGGGGNGGGGGRGVKS